jgi:hypothetical protein
MAMTQVESRARYAARFGSIALVRRPPGYPITASQMVRTSKAWKASAPQQAASAPQQAANGSQKTRARRVERYARWLLLPPALLTPALLTPALLTPALLTLLSPALLSPALLSPALLTLLSPALLSPALRRPTPVAPAGALWATPGTAETRSAAPVPGAATVLATGAARCHRSTWRRARDALAKGRSQREAAAHHRGSNHRALSNVDIHHGKTPYRGCAAHFPDPLTAYTEKDSATSFTPSCQQNRWSLPASRLLAVPRCGLLG